MMRGLSEDVRDDGRRKAKGKNWDKSNSVINTIFIKIGTAWESSSFFDQLNPRWFLQTEVVGTYLPGPETLSWGAWFRFGLLTPEISLLIFIYHMWV